MPERTYRIAVIPRDDTIGIAPSANINPERTHPSLFEPVHGSAPDIAGQGIANPIGQIWSVVMMLEHLGETEAAAAGIMRAIEDVLKEPALRTRDLGGAGETVACGKAVAERVRQAQEFSPWTSDSGCAATCNLPNRPPHRRR